ncbi:MAG: relaxase/mobilization nuclease domain-containing protein [Defluviitaleaceae bacterium]|nr:relaxase/mobilization nuclease domain-containing protein [Defluviitaleaceae bacterium]
MTAIAIIKTINPRRGNLAGLKAVINYIKDDAKTNGGKLVYMSGGMVGNEFESMVRTKNVFGKTTGRQYAHFVQSFHSQDNITPEMAYRIGIEYISKIKQWNDYQIAMAVHTDTENMHIHYVINSVNSKTGAKWQCSKQDLKHFREQSDELCRQYNLHVIERGNRGHQSSGEYKAHQQGHSWKQRLATDIADCLEQSTSRADFRHLLNDCGIDVDIGRTSTLFTVKAGTYGLKKEMCCGDRKLMGYGNFSTAAIEKHFAGIPSLQAMINSMADNQNLLFDAMYDLGQIFNIPHEDMREKFYNRSFTKLEGRALKEWILKNKDKAFEANSYSSYSITHEQENEYEM